MLLLSFQQRHLVISFIVLTLFLPSIFSAIYAEKSSITELRCKHHLTNFIKLGESVYKKRYEHNRVVNHCIDLFKDTRSNLYFDTSKVIPDVNTVSSKLLFDKSIGESFHLVKYKICNFEKESKQKILFNSKYETTIIVLPKSVASGHCAEFWTEINYGNIDSITISWDDDVKNLKMRRIF